MLAQMKAIPNSFNLPTIGNFNKIINNGIEAGSLHQIALIANADPS